MDNADRIAKLESDLKEARDLCEEGMIYMIEEQHEDAEEFCPPWEDLTLWLTLRGKLVELDFDEGING